MDNFTLSGKDFCRLVELISSDKNIFHIRIKGYGSSMSPFIKSGNELIIKPVKGEDTVKSGDIAAIINKDQERIIVHRIIGLKQNLFQIKGDNCSRDDGWFPKSCIIGIVTGIQTGNGKKICYKGWQNRIIAFLSRTRVLNILMLPLARFLKLNFQRIYINR